MGRHADSGLRGNTLKVVFLKDVPSVAGAGEIKEVAEGYGRNYLLPKGLAVLATNAELKKLEAQQQAGARRQAKLEAQAGAIAAKLEETPLTFQAKVGEQDRLYGSITSADIAGQISKVIGQDFDKRRIELEEPIRHLGTFDVDVKLSRDITAKVKVVVEGEKA